MNNFTDENGVVDREKLVEGHLFRWWIWKVETYHGVIVELNDEFVTVDFNHPYVRKNIAFFRWK